MYFPSNQKQNYQCYLTTEEKCSALSNKKHITQVVREVWSITFMQFRCLLTRNKTVSGPPPNIVRVHCQQNIVLKPCLTISAHSNPNWHSIWFNWAFCVNTINFHLRVSLNTISLTYFSKNAFIIFKQRWKKLCLLFTLC